MRKLEEIYGKDNVYPVIAKELDSTSTEDTKIVENELLQTIYDTTNEIPVGNQKSFKPKKK